VPLGAAESSAKFESPPLSFLVDLHEEQFFTHAAQHQVRKGAGDSRPAGGIEGGQSLVEDIVARDGDVTLLFQASIRSLELAKPRKAQVS